MTTRTRRSRHHKGRARPNADILVYGCDFAKGADGAAAAVELSRLTGGNVAASIDLTGAAKLGGNWVLEDDVGKIHTKTIDAPSWNYDLASVSTEVANADSYTVITGAPIVVDPRTNDTIVGGYKNATITAVNGTPISAGPDRDAAGHGH